MSSTYDSDNLSSTNEGNSEYIQQILLSENRTKTYNNFLRDEINNTDKKDELKNYNIKKLSWKVLDSYFANKTRLIQHHIDSYNHLIDTKIPNIFKNNTIILRCNYNEIIKKYTDRIEISFSNFSIRKPSIKNPDGKERIMWPNEARTRNLNYSAQLLIDVNFKHIKDINTQSESVVPLPDSKHVSLGDFPIMLGSKYCSLSFVKGHSKQKLGECIYDNGGYFIVKGSEKVIIMQERKCENKILAFTPSKTPTGYSDTVEINSICNITKRPKQTIIKKCIRTDKNNCIHVYIQRFNYEQPIPLFIVFRALGIISDKNIISKILHDPFAPRNKRLLDLLIPSINESSNIFTQLDALDYMSELLLKSYEVKDPTESELNYRRNKTLKNLKYELFPHIPNDFNKKAWFLGLMIKKLLLVSLKIIPHDDRDSITNKKINTSGDLLEELVKSNIQKIINDIRRESEKQIAQGNLLLNDVVENTIRRSYMENQIRYSLSTGTWGMQRSTTNKKGIAQPLPRLNFFDSLSSKRRVNSPIPIRGGRDYPIRKLRGEHYGIFCPFETPDGKNVGIVKSLALMAHITIESSPETVYNIFRNIDSKEYNLILINSIESLPYEDIDSMAIILINGIPHGFTSQPHKLCRKLRIYKRYSILHPYTSIVYHIKLQIISIRTCGGRLCRPLYVVNNNKLNMALKDFKNLSGSPNDWTLLIRLGKIEYVEKTEENYSKVVSCYEDLQSNKSIYFHNDYCEIHPSVMFGICVSTIPFANHNMGIRIMYEAAQKKQSLSVYASNYKERMDNPGQILRYPETPIVTTKHSKYLSERELPTGQNIIIAIACYTGFNQEDSIIMNKSSIERGLFSSMKYKTFRDSERQNQASLELETFCKPVMNNPNGTLRTIGTKSASYNLLDENGIVKLGSHVKGGDVIIGKVIPLKNYTGSGPTFRDASTSVPHRQHGIIDKRCYDTDSEGYHFVKVRMKTRKDPNIGDKFASRFGQKGTIGAIYDEEDMPYTREGITPDIIINPHAIPSRMTVGQLLEMTIGKSAVINGFECDATPFSFDTKDVSQNIYELLEKNGYSGDGTEEMYNGKTGEKFKARIFIGISYYQRLKYMSSDKIYARATGPLNHLTRQPPEGRKRDGGLRIGEMETWALEAHGLTSFLRERLFDNSDKYACYVCDLCGRIAIANPFRNIYECRYCKNNNSFSQLQIPYSTKLFTQELISMGVLPRLFT